MGFDFTGKTVVITGAATGIGAQCCRQFAEAGAFVALNYYPGERDERESAKLVGEIRAAGGKIERYGVDVSIEQDVYDMVKKIHDTTGRIDVVVNNAMTGAMKPFAELTSETLWHMMHVNFGGAFYMCKAAIPYMLEQGSGNVIMVSSSAFINGGGGSAAYPAAKGAMEGLMSGLVNEYAKYGLRFNTVRPSVVATDVQRARYNDEEWANYINKMPMRKPTSAKDQADAIMFLADDTVAGSINGHFLNVDAARMYHMRP